MPLTFIQEQLLQTLATNNAQISKKKFTESLSPRSSSEHQDPAYQIEESLESLSQELEDLISAKEALATQVEVLEESCIAVQSHISTLRRVASQLQTSSSTPPLKRRSKLGLEQVGAVPALQQADPFAEAVAEQFEPLA